MMNKQLNDGRVLPQKDDHSKKKDITKYIDKGNIEWPQKLISLKRKKTVKNLSHRTKCFIHDTFDITRIRKRNLFL